MSAPPRRSAARRSAVATASRGGVYYYAGGTICGLANARRWQSGLRCVAEPSGGSIDNLRALRTGAVQFAIVQSDWQQAAAAGTGPFEGFGPDRELRSVLSLFPEPFTVVARPQSGIVRLSDLAGKRVNIGPAGSGSRATAEVVLEAMGWSGGDFAHLSDLGWLDLPTELCEGEIDAALVIIAHPNLLVEEMMSACGAVLVPAEAEDLRALVDAHPAYFPYSIPAGTYPGQAAPVPGFALAAGLVTSSRVPPRVVRDLVGAISGNLPEFRARHPAFSEFGAEQMLGEGMSAPLYPGIRGYLEETGLLPVPANRAAGGRARRRPAGCPQSCTLARPAAPGRHWTSR
ncbi:TAXI family TRAP transporter solute-binding subunit [Mangrovicoccus ximenensis]|uniref:TAXI family TRAP transporter solute-binding subunit n=1 Tax=Mangrovicoccus ximenensis TaxID=1911570 RepID=UPI001374ADE9|nr:TAXI family TRAP transporter solute-binding subunit [Mangrovicoccus ximenensis]